MALQAAIGVLYALTLTLWAYGLEQYPLYPLRSSEGPLPLPWDTPLGEDATGNLVLHSLASLMQMKPNSRYPRGHSIVRASIPPGTLLYHGRGDSGYPYMDWLAFDPEHSRIFARSENGTLFTFTTTRELKLLYFDGCSANELSGTTDAQDILVWGEVDHGKPWDWQSQVDRINQTCAWGKPFGVDGYIRMEFDFEIMYCDFSDGLELVSAIPTVNEGGRPPPHGPDKPDDSTSSAHTVVIPGWPSYDGQATFHGLHVPGTAQGHHSDLRQPRFPPNPPEGWKGTWPVMNNSIRHAGSWHNDFPGDVRVHPDPSTLVSFYDPALTSLVAARRSVRRDDYRPGNISAEDMACVRSDVVEMIRRDPSERSGVDWRGLARAIQDRFSDRLPYLQYLLHQPAANVSEQVRTVRKQFIVSLLPYMQRPGLGEPEWFAQIAHSCATNFVTHLPVEKFTKQERILRHAIGEVLHEICRVLTLAWTEAFDVEEKSPDVAVALREKWKTSVDALVEWLDWPVWLKCDPACGVDEFCYLPQRGGPFDPEPDKDVDQTPQCVAIDSSWT